MLYNQPLLPSHVGDHANFALFEQAIYEGQIVFVRFRIVQMAARDVYEAGLQTFEGAAAGTGSGNHFKSKPA